MKTVEEEADESMYWLELMVEARLVFQGQAADLYQEADQIVAIAVQSIRAYPTSYSLSRGQVPWDLAP